jgi:hypothetical protein
MITFLNNYTKQKQMKKKRSSFKDKIGRSVERDKQRASSYGYLNLPKGTSIFKVEGGDRVDLDFLPYIVTDATHPDRDDEYGVATEGELWYRRPFIIHRNVGPNNETVVCPQSVGKPCPICEYRAKRFKEGAEKEETDAMKQSHRFLYAVIPIGHKKLEEKIHIWDFSRALFQNKLDQELEENEDYMAFPDLEEGLTLSVRFVEKQLGKNKFAEVSRIDFKERDSAYDEEILEDVPNLDEMLNIPSYKQLQQLFFEMETLDPEADTEDDEPLDDEPKVANRRKKKTLKKADPEPEEEDDEEEEEEEDDEPTPPVRRKKKVKDPEPEPEEEEEDEDEEEEPAPVKRKTKPAPATKSKSKGKDRCPHGHRFGVDAEDFDECDECELWDECIEEKENA